MARSASSTSWAAPTSSRTWSPGSADHTPGAGFPRPADMSDTRTPPACVPAGFTLFGGDRGMAEPLYDARTFWELLDRRATATPDHPMLIDATDRVVTFSEFR